MWSSVTPDLQQICFHVMINLVACIPSITVDAKLEPFSMHIICERLDARWKCLSICNKVTLRNKKCNFVNTDHQNIVGSSAREMKINKRDLAIGSI
jgi:hypothetical protein